MRDNNDCLIRLARPDDAAALLEIYAPYVWDTAITFEYTPPSEEEFQRRILSVEERYPYLVAEQHGRIAGYAYASRFKERAAYDWDVETSIYLRMDERHHGLGWLLYEKLEAVLRLQGVVNLHACITSAPDGTAACLGTVRLFTNPTATPLLAVFAAVVTNSGAGTTLSGWKNPLESTRLI